MTAKQEKRLREKLSKEIDSQQPASYVVFHGDERIFTTKEGMIEFLVAIHKIKLYHAR